LRIFAWTLFALRLLPGFKPDLGCAPPGGILLMPYRIPDHGYPGEVSCSLYAESPDGHHGNIQGHFTQWNLPSPLGCNVHIVMGTVPIDYRALPLFPVKNQICRGGVTG